MMIDTTSNPNQPLIRFEKSAFLIAGLALLLRWIHLAFIWSSDLVRIPIIDSAFYHHWASQIAAGEFVGNGVFFMSPLYPYFLGLIYSVFGTNAGMALIIQSIIGAATVYLVYLWVEELLDRRYAIVSSALAAIYAPLIFYDGALLTSSIIMFLSAIILYLTSKALREPTTLGLMTIGGLFGLSALARPLALIPLALFGLLFFIKERNSSARRWLVLASGAGVVLFTVGLRNLIVGGEFTLTTSSAGMNFYIGNNPEATGLYWEAPFLTSAEPQFEDEDYRQVASEAVERELTTREAGSYWFRKSLDWAINHPIDYLKLLSIKTFYFWNRAEFANNTSIYLGRELSPILRFNPLGFWLLAPVGLGGLILFWRRKGLGVSALPIIWAVSYFIGCAIFFVSSEYRLPIALPLFLGAGFFIIEFIELLRQKKVENALKVSVLPLLILPFVNYRTEFIIRGENARMDWFNIANTLYKNDDPAGAAIRFERSLAVDPYFAEAMLKLAEAYYRSGKTEEAIAIGKRAGLPNPESILNLVQGSALHEAYARLNEGNLVGAMREFAAAGYDPSAASAETTKVSLLNAARKAFESGDVNKSLEHFHAILASDSTREPSIYYNIAFLNYQLGRLDSAVVFAETALEIDSLNGPAASLLQRIYRSMGKDAEAEKLLQRFSPDNKDRETMLTAIREVMDSLEVMGQWEKALDAYQPYGRIFFDVAPEDKWRLGRLQYRVGNYDIAIRLLGEAETALAMEPGIPLYQGWTFLGLGRLTEAETAFQRCLSIDPDRADARVSLARIYFQRGQIEKSWNELDKLSVMKFLDQNLETEYHTLLDSVKAKM